jgi:hypothetical protein
MADEDKYALLKSRLNKSLYWHRIVLIGGLIILFLINRLTAGSGWFFWVCLAWSVIFAVHFFVVKSINVDEDWADDRAYELREKSYDLKHIRDIRKSYIKPRSARSKTQQSNSSSTDDN